MSCGGQCRDVSTDGLNCGACGRACALGLVCSVGQCACPAGTSCMLPDAGEPPDAGSPPDAGTDAGTDAGSPCVCPNGCCRRVGASWQCRGGASSIECGSGSALCATCDLSFGETCSGAPRTCVRPGTGNACAGAGDCSGLGAGAVCRLTNPAGTRAYDGGYCTKLGCQMATVQCPADGLCELVPDDGYLCVAKCAQPSDCRGGYHCEASAQGGWCAPDLPDAGEDAGVDAGEDAGVDAGVDAGPCLASPGPAYTCSAYCGSIGKTCSESCVWPAGGAAGTAAWQPGQGCAGANAGVAPCNYAWGDAAGAAARWRCCCN